MALPFVWDRIYKVKLSEEQGGDNGSASIVDYPGSPQSVLLSLVYYSFDRLLMKFPQSRKVWLSYFEYIFQQSGGSSMQLDKIRVNLKSKTLKVLPKHKHKRVLTKFAQMEFQYGDYIRGQEIFDNLLSSSHNKPQLDVWSIYFDCMIKLVSQSPQGGENEERLEHHFINEARRVFERAVSMQLKKPFKMKFIFKRWLEFEKKHVPTSIESQADRVKQLAIDYIQTLQEE